jgi:hypothetical protein
MSYFHDVSALHRVVGVLYRNVPSDERRAMLSRFLEEDCEFTPDQASLFASTVLDQNAEGSADAVMTNGTRIAGNWILSEQEGNVGSWQSTTRETWLFNIDLTYEHKIERYDSSITTGPFFQSSYSRPKMSLQRGIWAPSDNTLDQLRLFVMSTEGHARPMMFEWVEKEKYNFRACTINMQRFVRE